MPTPHGDLEFDRLAAMPDAVSWVMALTGVITEISPSIEAVRGLTPQEAMAQGADEIHPPSSLKVSLAYFERFSVELLAGRIPEPFHADLEYLHKDGSSVWCEVYASPVVDDHGHVIELRGVSVPVNRAESAPPDTV